MKFCGVFLIFSLIFFGCNAPNSIIDVTTLPNYNKKAADHIVFLNFKISDGGNGRREKVELVHEVSGSGKMKNIENHVEYPNYIKAVRIHSDGRSQESIYQHPLFKEVEVASPEGKIENQLLTSDEGILTMRFQEDKSLEKIDLYSVSARRGTRRIYTVSFKER